MDAKTRLVLLGEAWANRGEAIKAAREEGMAWDDIAEALNLSRATVIRLYNSENVSR